MLKAEDTKGRTAATVAAVAATMTATAARCLAMAGTPSSNACSIAGERATAQRRPHHLHAHPLPVIGEDVVIGVEGAPGRGVDCCLYLRK